METKIFNLTHEELIHNKYDVFIGISVGIKPMTTEIAIAYLNWAISHSSKKVQILIADEIARYNYLVFSHSTTPGALSRAIRDGDAYEAFFETVLNTSFFETRSSFNIIRWKDIKGERFSEILKEIQSEYALNESFREDLFSILNPYIERRGKTISLDQKIFLGQYLLEELATLLDGIYVDGINYRLILYPTYRYSGMSEIVSNIQNKQKYSNLSERLKLHQTIMVESLIENDLQ